MIERKPREQQTPRTEALFLLGEIDQIYSQLTQEPQGHFAKNLFPLLYDDPTTSGDNAFLILESEWARTLQEPKPFPVLLHLITVSAAYAVEALKAYANDLPTAGLY